MRLIDVHKLQKAIYQHPSQRSMTKEKILQYCKEQPTVEAIPTKWIRDWLETEYCKQHLGNAKTHVWEMLSDWEKENE